jgi:hypothetical protein
MYKPSLETDLDINPEAALSVFTLLAWSIYRECSLDLHTQVSLYALECASNLR